MADSKRFVRRTVMRWARDGPARPDKDLLERGYSGRNFPCPCTAFKKLVLSDIEQTKLFLKDMEKMLRVGAACRPVVGGVRGTIGGRAIVPMPLIIVVTTKKSRLVSHYSAAARRGGVIIKPPGFPWGISFNKCVTRALVLFHRRHLLHPMRISGALLLCGGL